MITTPEIICDLFSFLDKNQIERFQIVNQFWNSVIIRHKNILPLRQFDILDFYRNKIHLYVREDPKEIKRPDIYSIKFDGTNLSKTEENVSPRYSQLTVDEVLTNLNDVVFDYIQIQCDDCDCDSYCDCVSYYYLNFLNMMKLVTAKTGGRFRGPFGVVLGGRFGSKLDEIFDNYIIVDQLDYCRNDSFIREICANPEILQLPSTPKEITLSCLIFKENDKVLDFTCNGKLNGANRLTIESEAPSTNYENFIRQWFELYRTHENPISLVGKFKLDTFRIGESVLDAVKTFLNSTQLRVKYSLEDTNNTNDFPKRSCVLHETDSYALVIEMEYEKETDMSSINASDLDQPPCNQMWKISFCVKSL